MKKISLLILSMLTSVLSWAQNDVAYPVDLNVQIIPPYNTCIRDLAPAELNGELGRFRVTMLVRDINHSYHPFKIRMKVRSTSGREIFSTISGEIRVQAGYPNLLSSNQLLNDFFAAHNIFSGAGNLKNGCFEEGAYIFAFQVVEGGNPSLPVSREVQCFTFLEKGAPPMLLYPANRSILQTQDGILIPFQWQLPYLTNIRETFQLEVYEVPQGLNPNEVFDNNNLQVIVQDNIPMTVCFVEKTAGTLEAGKQYAWRVRIKDREAYINHGISEVFTFSCGTSVGATPEPEETSLPTLPKVIIDTVITNSSTAVVYWQNDPENFTGYIVEVRRCGSDSPWSSTSAGYEDSTLNLTNIAPKIKYEVRIKGIEQQSEGLAEGIYSDTLTFQLPSVEDNECGKPLPPLNGSTPTPPGQEPYFTFYANGQAVEIENITTINEDHSFSGTGYIDFPLLKQVKIKVSFDNIQINENKELLLGTVRTIYDESTGLIMDVNRLLNKGDGGTADGPVTPLKKTTYPSKEAAMTGLKEGEFGQVSGSDSLYLKTADNKLISVGTVLPETFKYENTGKIETNVPYIVFSQPEGTNLAFDNNSRKSFDNVYRLKDTYEKQNANYTVPWLAMNPGKIEHIDATVAGGATIDSVKFIMPLSDGSTLQLTHNRTYDVHIPGGSAGTTTEIFAVAQIGETNKVVGKLKIANYAAKTQKVNLVPVRRDKESINGREIESKLNEIYGRLGIKFEVTVKERFGEKDAGDPADELNFLDDGLEVDNKGFWSNETKEMKYLKYLYHEAHANAIAKDAAYLFVIDYTNHNAVQGDMPRGKQSGYIFCENKETFADGRLVAHELGHGLYGLQHTFSPEYGVPQGTTDNLMDYNNEDFLAAWQWKIINNPMIVWNFLEGDESGMKKINLRPSGCLSNFAGVEEILLFLLKEMREKEERNERNEMIYNIDDYDISSINEGRASYIIEQVLGPNKIKIRDGKEAHYLIERYVEIYAYEQFEKHNKEILSFLNSKENISEEEIKNKLLSLEKLKDLSLFSTILQNIVRMCEDIHEAYKCIDSPAISTLRSNILAGTSSITSQGIKDAMLQMSNTKFKEFIRSKKTVTNTQMMEIISKKNAGVFSEIISGIANPQTLGRSDLEKIFNDIQDLNLYKISQNSANFNLMPNVSIKTISSEHLGKLGNFINLIVLIEALRTEEKISPADVFSTIPHPYAILSYVVDDVVKKLERENTEVILEASGWNMVLKWDEYYKGRNQAPTHTLYLYYVNYPKNQEGLYNPNIAPTSIVINDKELATKIFGFTPSHVVFYLQDEYTNPGTPNTQVDYLK